MSQRTQGKRRAKPAGAAKGAGSRSAGAGSRGGAGARGAGSRGGTKGAARTAATGSTRDRILDAAMTLFADLGYRGTTVGDIESAAGLAPRSGALYQHFSGKEEVLRAALERHIEDLAEIQSALDMFPLGDFRSEVTLMGRWTLQDLKRRERLHRFVRKEGAQFPELLDQVREAVHDEPHLRLAEWIRRTAADAGAEEPDAEALALIIAGSMGHYRSLESIYGEVPLGIDDERFLAAWTEMCLAVAQRVGIPIDGEPSGSAARPSGKASRGQGRPVRRRG